MKLSKIKRGFTLIEILLVVSILSVILVVVFAALNPAQRLQDARDANRWNDVNQILTAIHECIVDGGGAACYDSVTDGETWEIVSDAAATTGCDDVCTGATADTSCADLDAAIGPSAGTTYLGTIPEDPGGVATNHTEYSITNTGGVLTVTACAAEGSATISVSR